MDLRSKISAVISQLCTVLLSLLGYNCSSSPFNEPELMYGSPYSTFELKGTVTNEEGKPVNDAEIVVSTPWAIVNWETKPTILWEFFAKTVSNGEGAYFLNKTYWTDSLKIICVPAGNAYQADSAKVALDYKFDDKHPQTEWYLGHATLTVDFKLKDNQ